MLCSTPSLPAAAMPGSDPGAKPLRMDRQKMPPDTISWTAAMGACVKEAWLQGYCFNAVASACEKGDRWDVALSVLAMMNVRRLPPEIVTYNAAMASCKRNGLWEVALQLMEQSKATSQLPDVISFNCLIGTCHLAGRWDLSLHFLSAMQPSALAPDRSSYTEAAGACEKSSQWQHALEVLSSALSQQLVPDGTCVGAVAGALRSAKGEDAALGVLQQLRKRWSPQNAEPENFGGGIPVIAKRPGVLVVSKPEGLSTEDMLERLFGNRWPTVVQTVSRLDYPTSGVLPIALGPEGSAECSWLQAEGGVGDEGTITKPLRTVGVGSLRTEVSPSGRYARTGYRILRRFPGSVGSALEPKLLLAMPETGRTH
ncbi:Pentatricopeptide repeat-containing protein, chloroplastic, partial [Symbiodinium microadriaticum]